MSSYYNHKVVESALIGLHATYSSYTDLMILPNLTYQGRTCRALRIDKGSVTSKDAV
jgi:hypothetical protein